VASVFSWMAFIIAINSTWLAFISSRFSFPLCSYFSQQACRHLFQFHSVAIFTFTFTFIFISGSNLFPMGMDIKHVTYYRFKMTIYHSSIYPINNIIRPLTDSSSCQIKTHGSWKNLKQSHILPLHIHWQAISLKQLQL
jgi:hypothetical protein